MEARTADPVAKAAEAQVARKITGEAEAQGTPGIYVYALPHYLNFPVDPISGHTLMKVGRSDRDVIQRFRAQVRTTSLPEDPILLRIYVTEGEGSTQQEHQFHNLLEAADHSRSTARSGGTEWFMTSLRFLDTVAETIGLEIRTVFDPESGE
jgi:T5orf172 domain